ncbi:MAG: hypothetical protein ACLQVK_04675 [Acidimicrobiales bacterium]
MTPAGVSTSPQLPPEPKFTIPPGPMQTPPLVPLGESLAGGQPVIPAAPLWSGGSLQARTTVNVPLTLAGLVLAFALTQWLIDRRDPKFVEAPSRKDDDSIGFE